MLLQLAEVCALFATAMSAYLTQEVVDTSAVNRLPVEEMLFYIPERQCSAWVESTLLMCHYDIFPESVRVSPVKLNVSVLDLDYVMLSLHDLQSVMVYRAAPCEGRAQLTVQRQCAAPLPPLRSGAPHGPPAPSQVQSVAEAFEVIPTLPVAL